MRKLYIIIVLGILQSFIINFHTFAQPGCPNVNAGPDVTLSCSSPCTTLTATPLATGATTSYAVSTIPYAPPYPYNTGNPILLNIDDYWSSTITMPFNFCYYGTAYNQIVAGSNGVVSFDLSNSGGYCPWSFTATCPSSSLILNAIFGVYHDIDPSVSGTMYYAILGTYPCRTFVVNWNQIAMFSCNSMLATHQIVLYESTNVIEVYVQNKPLCSTWNSGNGLIGIQNSTGTVGLTPPGRNTSQWTASNEAWRFTPNGAPNYTLSWYQGPTLLGTGATINVCPTSTTTYTAQCTYTNCDGTVVVVTDDVVVNYNNQIGLTLNPVNQDVCYGESATIIASSTNPLTTYSWSTGSSIDSINVTPSITSTYTVTASIIGCTTTSTATVTVNPIPVVAVNSPTICNGTPASLTATGANSYLWSTGGTSATISVNPSSTTTYTVTGTSLGCTNTAISTVTVSAIPTIAVNSPTTCVGVSATLTATGGTTYEWSTGETTNPIIVNPASSTTYTVTGTTAGCSNTAISSVTVNPSLNVVVNSDTICDGEHSTLTATGGTTYLWNTGSTSNPLTVSPNSTTIYTVTGTSLGCTGTAVSTVTVNPNPQPSITSTNSICGRNDGTANALPSGLLYLWSNNSTSQNLTDLHPGTYTLTVTDTNGCFTSTNVTIQDIMGPVANFSANPLYLILYEDPLCTFIDNSYGAISWDWNFGDGTTGTGQNVSHEYLNVGFYTVVLAVQDANQCKDSAQVVIQVKDIYSIYIPNTFTPNGDGNNDFFGPVGTNIDTKDFEMTIFTRWGEKVYHTTDLNKPWNGTINNSRGSKDGLMGVYSYVITAKEINGRTRQYVGTVSLIH